MLGLVAEDLPVGDLESDRPAELLAGPDERLGVVGVVDVEALDGALPTLELHDEHQFLLRRNEEGRRVLRTPDGLGDGMGIYSDPGGSKRKRVSRSNNETGTPTIVFV